MNFIRNIIRTPLYNTPLQAFGYAVAIVLTLVLAACGDEDVPYVNTNHDVTVSFTLAVGDAETVTRAGNVDWTDYDSIDGTGFENVVDLATLQVYFYDSENNYLSRLERLTLRPQDDTHYTVEGTMRVDTTRLSTGFRFNGKMMVYANTNGAGALANQAMGATEVSNISYSYTPGTSLSSIPMWGVKTLTNANFTPGERYNAGDVWMLRSLAKVEVSLSDDLKNRGYTLEQVTFDRYNTQAYVTPSGYTDVAVTRLLTYDTGAAQSFHPYPSMVEQPVDFTNKTLYLPEYDNATNPATITITLRDPKGELEEGELETPATLPFGEYDKGGLYVGNMNIVRNHYYKFEVLRSRNIRIRLTVLPWTKFTHEEIIM